MVIAELKRGEAPYRLVIDIVNRLERGEVLVLPTDTVYGLHASARNAVAVEKVKRIKRIDGNHPFSTVYSSVVDVGKWVKLPESDEELRKIVDSWPGAVTWVLPAQPSVPKHMTGEDKTLGIRIPSHPLLRAITTALHDPIISTSANRHGQAPVIRGDDLDPGLIEEVDGVVLEIEPLQGNPSEVKRWTPGGAVILRSRLSEAAGKQERLNTLVVCSGNICRSPVVERMLAQKLKEAAPEKFLLRSAGTIARNGDKASLFAVEVSKELGYDITSHRSRRVTKNLMEWADIVLAMTTDHLGDLHDMFPDETGKVYLFTSFPEPLAEGQFGIDDPFGQSMEIYRECIIQIEKHVERIVPHLLKKVKI